MTNIVFVDHKKIHRTQAQSIKQDLHQYALSIVKKFSKTAIPETYQVRVAKFSVNNLLKQFDFSTKNLSVLLQEEVVRNLQELCLKLKKQSLSEKLLDMVKVVKRLRRQHPRKYKKLHNLLKQKLNGKQVTVFNIYLGFKPRGKRQHLTYKTVSRLSKIPAGTINPQVKNIVRNLNRLFKKQRISKNER
jgi:hypothetical protein